MPHLFITGYGPVSLRRSVIDPRDAARVLGVDSRVVRNMLRRGELTNISADHRRRIAPAEINDLIERGVAAGELSPLCRIRLARLVSTPPGNPWRAV